MSTSEGQNQTRFDELKPGDRIEVEHTATVGSTSRAVKTTCTVVRTESRRHGSHIAHDADDKTYGDVILLELPDGELITVTMDEFTVLRRA